MSPPVSENWEAYLCMVEDKPASILVNLDLMRQAPLQAFPVLWHLGLSLNEPDEHGLPGPEEYQGLGRIEDALFAALPDAVYAGRSIRDGEADFFFYLPRPPAASPLQTAGGEAAEAALAGYDWESGSSHDPAWNVYKGFLFPDEYDMLGIQNRRTVSRLEHMGDEPELARAVEHWLDFPSTRAREKAADLAREQGFAAAPDELPPEGILSDVFLPEELSGVIPPGRLAADDHAPGGTNSAQQPEQPGPACLRLVRQDTLEAIDDVVFFLARLADEYGGRYRGWACAPATNVPPLDGEGL